MKRLLALTVALVFAAAGAPALAADPAKDAPKTTAAAKKPLEKPAGVTADAWAKMSDAEKAKAIEAAGGKPAKKEKKGGC